MFFFLNNLCSVSTILIIHVCTTYGCNTFMYNGHLNHNSTLLTEKLQNLAPIPTNPQNPSSYIEFMIQHHIKKCNHMQQISAHISLLHVSYRKKKTVLANHSTPQTLWNSTVLVNSIPNILNARTSATEVSLNTTNSQIIDNYAMSQFPRHHKVPLIFQFSN
jgi:hypothetical protein